jgi:hypothetical protein
VQNNTKPSPPLDVGPLLARTKINLCVILASPSGKGSTHTNSLVGVTPRGQNNDTYQQVATSFPEAHLQRTLKLCVLGLEKFRDG